MATANHLSLPSFLASFLATLASWRFKNPEFPKNKACANPGVRTSTVWVWNMPAVFSLIADSYNHKIKKVDTRTGVCYSVLGDWSVGFQDRRGASARFSEPAGLIAAGSYLYITDTNNHAIRRAEIDTMTVTGVQFPGLCAPDVCVPV